MTDVPATPMRRPGRPPVADKHVQRPFKANAAEWAKIQADARAAGLPVSVYIRRCLGL